MPSTPPRLAKTDATTPDAADGWVDRLPLAVRPYARLARLDRPAGSWLLFWPCGWGLALAGGLPAHSWLLALFGLGAVAMRAAGCVYNDIVDRDLDRQVARTRDRPVASGRVSVRAASAWLVILGLCALPVLVALPPDAALVAVASLALVAAYPFMKRVTWWPQAWLGLTFNWGVLVGWLAVAPPSRTMLLLYAAGACWTLGYDTIYALQDIEDDALAGIKSSARALGQRARAGIALFYALALALLTAAIASISADRLALLTLLPAAAHIVWQVAALRDNDPARALRLFRSNIVTGALIFGALATIGLA